MGVSKPHLRQVGYLDRRINDCRSYDAHQVGRSIDANLRSPTLVANVGSEGKSFWRVTRDGRPGTDGLLQR